MTCTHRHRHPQPPINQVEELLRVLLETHPAEGHLVVTAWVSPDRLSEADRVRLHEHLIEAHGALSILTMGLSKPTAH